MTAFCTACRHRPNSMRLLALHGFDRFAARKTHRRTSGSARAARQNRADDAHGAAWRPLGRRGRAVPDRSMVRRRQDTGAAGDRGGARAQDHVRAGAMGSDVLQLDGEHPAVVHFPADLVGASNSRPGMARTAKSFVAENEDDAVADALAHYTDIEEITVEEGHDIAADPERRARFANEYLHRDEDVLDTWFSSALWPFSTLGWPDETPELKRYYPTSALVTGFDIIFFWVARMMMMGLHFMKEVPFHDRLHPRAGARRHRRQDVEVERQRHRSARSHRRIRRRCAALHACRHGGAGPRHQAFGPARRGLPQFCDQALECGALCGNERLRARSGFHAA